MRLFWLYILMLCTWVSNAQLVPVQLDGKWGFENSMGELVVKAKFDEVLPFSEDLAAVRKGEKWGYVTKNGKWQIKPKWKQVREFSNGLAPVLAFDTDYWGYVDTEGELSIAARFKVAGVFDRGLALVTGKESKKYFVGTSGRVASEQFDKVLARSDSSIKVHRHIDGVSETAYLKADGVRQSPWLLHDFELGEPVQIVTRRGRVDNKALMNGEGRVLTGWYDYIGEEINGQRVFVDGGLYALIDKEGQEIMEPKYKHIHLDTEACIGKRNGRYYLLNDGKEISQGFMDMDHFHDGVSVVKKDRNTGYAIIDLNGKLLTGWLTFVHPFSEGIARIEKGVGNPMYAYFNRKSGQTTQWYAAIRRDFVMNESAYEGALLHRESGLNPVSDQKLDFFDHKKFDLFKDNETHSGVLSHFEGGDFYQGRAAVAKRSEMKVTQKKDGTYYDDRGRFGFIDIRGVQVIGFDYDAVGDFSEGMAPVKQGEKCGFITLNGDVVIDLEYENLGDFKGGLAPAKRGDWGFVDHAGKMIIDFQYEDVLNFSWGLAAVKTKGKWGFINHDGKLIVPCEYDKVQSFKGSSAAVMKNGRVFLINKENLELSN